MKELTYSICFVQLPHPFISSSIWPSLST
jgi:hypothetical protein